MFHSERGTNKCICNGTGECDDHCRYCIYDHSTVILTDSVGIEHEYEQRPCEVCAYCNCSLVARVE